MYLFSLNLCLLPSNPKLERFLLLIILLGQGNDQSEILNLHITVNIYINSIPILPVHLFLLPAEEAGLLKEQIYVVASHRS